MSCLAKFFRVTKDAVIWLIGSGFIRALLVRLPPRNYSHDGLPFSPLATDETRFFDEGCSVFAAVDSESSLDESRSDVTLVNHSFDDSSDFTPDLEDVDSDDPSLFICKKCRTSEQISMAILKAASDRVGDILREHRQKVDAGEDPCAKRREARRRRTQELVLLAGVF